MKDRGNNLYLYRHSYIFLFQKIITFSPYHWNVSYLVESQELAHDLGKHVENIDAPSHLPKNSLQFPIPLI